jgi:hypothetical protein
VGGSGYGAARAFVVAAHVEGHRSVTTVAGDVEVGERSVG